MKTFKKVLTVLGGLFACVLVLVGFVAFQATSFRREQEPFVRKFMSDYSRRWDVGDVYDRLTPDFLTQIKSPDGEQAVSYFRRLGRVQEISDVSVQNYTVGTGAKQAVFMFKARFEAAPAIVNLTLIEKDGSVRVEGLHVTPAAELAPIMAAHSPI